jgi:hypothetical protein
MSKYKTVEDILLLGKLQSSGIKLHVVRIWTGVSEERTTSIIRVENQPAEQETSVRAGG